jgi:hypothetical protein
MMKMLDLYREFLADAGAVVGQDGFVTLDRFGEKEPWLVKGKRLALPTQEQLRNFNGEKTVIFHPLYENAIKGESDVLADFRRMIGERISLSFMALAVSLLTIATSEKMHKKLTPPQSKFLTLIPDAHPDMIETLAKLIEACPLGQNQRVFTSIYLAKNAELHGKKHKRVSVVSWPLYQALVVDGLERERKMEERGAQRDKAKKDGEKKELPTPKNETYGVKLSAKERTTFIRLFEYLVPGLNEAYAVSGDMGEVTYSRASDSLVAPSMHALMQSIEAIIDPLNAICDLFEDKLGDSYQAIRMKGEWVEAFNPDPSVYRDEIKMVPPTIGNDGTPLEAVDHKPAAAPAKGAVTAKEERAAQEAEAEASPVEEVPVLPPGFKLPARQAPLTPQHQHQSAPPPQAPMPTPYHQPHATPGYPPPHQAYPQHGSYPPPAAYPPPGAYPAPHHQQGAPAAQVRTAGGRVDFNAAKQVNPAVATAAYQAAPGMPLPPGAVPMQQHHQPSWAAPQGGPGAPGGYQQGGYPPPPAYGPGGRRF